MWHVRLVVLVLINAAVILFALANLRETVTVRWISASSEGVQVSLTAALVAAYLFGLLTLLVFSAAREVRLRRRCARLERQMQAMREELNALRTAPFEEALVTEPAGREAED